MGELDKFWLGNVNEKGEVDQEGYDDDTKEGLLKTTREEKLSSNSVNATDTTGGDEDFQMPVNSVVKSKNAVDYTDEQEAAEDDASNDKYVERAKALLNRTAPAAAQSVRRTDDDYDDEEEEDEQAPGSSSAKPPAPAAAPPGDPSAAAHAHVDAAEGQAPAAVPGAAGDVGGGASAKDRRRNVAGPQKVDPWATQVNLRKNGMLMLSEMYDGPVKMPRMIRGRKNTFSLNSKVRPPTTQSPPATSSVHPQGVGRRNCPAPPTLLTKWHYW